MRVAEVCFKIALTIHLYTTENICKHVGLLNIKLYVFYIHFIADSPYRSSTYVGQEFVVETFPTVI